MIILISYEINYTNNNDLGSRYKYIDLGHDYWQSIFKEEVEVVPVKLLEYYFYNKDTTLINMKSKSLNSDNLCISTNFLKQFNKLEKIID